MELRQKLETQTKISQEMVQAVSILQMTAWDLKQYVQETMLENPVIELEETTKKQENDDTMRKLEWLESGDYQNKVYYQQEMEESSEFWEENEPDLREYLLEQLAFMDLDKRISSIISYMIQSLDERGYLLEKEEEIVDILGISLEEVQKARQILCTMEPLGVGALNLQECLLIQLRKKGCTSLACEIVENYIDEFGKNQLSKIAKETGKSLKEVTQACEQIKEQNPKPAGYFPARPYKNYIIPDVIVVKLKDHFEILVNDYDSPEIYISPFYGQMMREQGEETGKYIKEKIRQAEWLKNCIEQRNHTLLQLTEEILRSQTEFFKKGRSYLRPMTQKEIAEKLRVHPSTVSRAVQGKYLQCTWGMYPLSFFFSSGTDKGVEYVKKCLKDIIDKEDKKNPYSDRVLAEKLQEMGIDISRRTIAKYRNTMCISEALGRKEY